MKEHHLNTSSPRSHRTAREAFGAGAVQIPIAARAAPRGRRMKIGCGLRRIAKLLVSGQRLRRRFKGEEGQSLVEMAVALPLMLLFLTGAVSFTLAFYNLQELQNAVIVAGQGLGATAGLVANPCAQVVSQVQAALPGWTASSLIYTVVITNAAGTPQPAYNWTGGTAPSGCTAAGSGGSASTAEGAGQAQTLTVSFPYSWFTIFTWQPFGNSSPSGNLAYSYSVMAD